MSYTYYLHLAYRGRLMKPTINHQGNVLSNVKQKREMSIVSIYAVTPA